MELLAALFVVFANAEDNITGSRFYQTLLDDYPHLPLPNLSEMASYNYPLTAEALASFYLTGLPGAVDFNPAIHYDQAIQQGGVVSRIEAFVLQPGDTRNTDIVDVITDIYESEQTQLCSSVIVYKPT